MQISCSYARLDRSVDRPIYSRQRNSLFTAVPSASLSGNTQDKLPSYADAIERALGDTPFPKTACQGSAREREAFPQLLRYLLLRVFFFKFGDGGGVTIESAGDFSRGPRVDLLGKWYRREEGSSSDS